MQILIYYIVNVEARSNRIMSLLYNIIYDFFQISLLSLTNARPQQPQAPENDVE